MTWWKHIRAAVVIWAIILAGLAGCSESIPKGSAISSLQAAEVKGDLVACQVVEVGIDLASWRSEDGAQMHRWQPGLVVSRSVTVPWHGEVWLTKECAAKWEIDWVRLCPGNPGEPGPSILDKGPPRGSSRCLFSTAPSSARSGENYCLRVDLTSSSGAGAEEMADALRRGDGIEFRRLEPDE